MLAFALITLCIFHGSLAFGGMSVDGPVSEDMVVVLGLVVLAGLVADAFLVKRSYDWDPLFERHARLILGIIFVACAFMDVQEEGLVLLLVHVLVYGLHAMFVCRFFHYETELSFLGQKTLATGLAVVVLALLSYTETELPQAPAKLCIVSNILMALGYCVAFGTTILRSVEPTPPRRPQRARRVRQRASSSNVIYLH